MRICQTAPILANSIQTFSKISNFCYARKSRGRHSIKIKIEKLFDGGIPPCTNQRICQTAVILSAVDKFIVLCYCTLCFFCQIVSNSATVDKLVALCLHACKFRVRWQGKDSNLCCSPPTLQPAQRPAILPALLSLRVFPCAGIKGTTAVSLRTDGVYRLADSNRACSNRCPHCLRIMLRDFHPRGFRSQRPTKRSRRVLSWKRKGCIYQSVSALTLDTL